MGEETQDSGNSMIKASRQEEPQSVDRGSKLCREEGG